MPLINVVAKYNDHLIYFYLSTESAHRKKKNNHLISTSFLRKRENDQTVEIYGFFSAAKCFLFFIRKPEQG